MNIIKIRDSPFSLFTWYQSQKGKPNFFSVIMFPSGHFILLSEPSTVGSPRLRSRCRISLPSVTFSGQLFSSRKPQIPRRMRPIYTSEETPPENSSPQAATGRYSPAACLPRVGACVPVWARGPLSGDEISYPGSSGTVLLIHPSGGPPRALLIHLFAHFISTALRQSLFSTVWVTFLHLQFHNRDSPSY